MKIKIILLTLILFALFSCKSGEIKSKGTPVAFNEIKTGENSAYSKFTTLEIHSFKELSASWTKLFAKYDRKPPIPTIDYEKNMLLVVALGERSNAGYAIKVKSIMESKNELSVITEETKPGNTCNSAMVMAYPFQLIEIPKTEKPIKFRMTVKINECGKGF